MAGQLLLVNPKRRRRSRSGGKRRKSRSAAQRRATAKMLAANRSRRRTNPGRSRRRRRVVGYAVGSGRVRRRKMNPRRRRRYSNPVTRHRRRRNPSMRGSVGGIMNTAMDAGIGAGGALVTDIAWSFLPLPATMKTGAIGTLAKAATSIALGIVGSKVVGGAMARKATVGALTVQIYAFVKPMLAGVVPGLGYYGAGYALNGFVPNSLSDTPSSLNAYISGEGYGINGLNDYSDFTTDNAPGIDLSEYIR